MKKKILVFPCGSEIGLEINNALKYSTRVELFGASSVANHGKYVYKNYIEDLPHVDSNNFIEELNRIIDKYKIDLIFPAHDSVILKLAQNSSNIRCNIIGSSVATCEICRSKSSTYRVLKGIVSIPRVYEKKEVPEKFPVFLKPDVGQGSRGTFIANSLDEIKFYRDKDPSLLILEYLPGDEYTVDCFTNNRGDLLFAGARKRARISNGISVNTFPAKETIFINIAKEINRRIKFRGVWFFQLKADEQGTYSLLEVAPRIAGSMALYRNLGINFAFLSVFDALDIQVSVEYSLFNIEMDRSLCNRFSVDLKYDHVYIDLDDTIIFDSKINIHVMMFLYQCLNKNVKIHLLTRHKDRFGEDVRKTLEAYKILGVFSSITDVTMEEKKSMFIKEKNAIFIDDSFSERREVLSNLNIPVFEVNSLECLINWKS